MENDMTVLHTVFILTYDEVNRNYKSLLKKRKVTPDSLHKNYSRVTKEEFIKNRNGNSNAKYTCNKFQQPCIKPKIPPVVIDNVKLHCFKNEAHKEYVLFLTRENEQHTNKTAYLYLRKTFKSKLELDNGLIRTLFHTPKNYKKMIGVEKIWENTVRNEIYNCLGSLEGYVDANAIFITNNPNKPKSYVTQNIKSKRDANKFIEYLTLHNKSCDFKLEDFNIKDICAVIVVNQFGQRLYLELTDDIKMEFPRKNWSTIDCNGKQYVNVERLNRKLNHLKIYSPEKNYMEVNNYSFNTKINNTCTELLPKIKSSSHSHYNMMLEQLQSENSDCDPIYDCSSNQNCVKNIMSKFTDSFKNLYSFLTKPKSAAVLNKLMSEMIDLSKEEDRSKQLAKIKNDNLVYIVTQINTPFNNNVKTNVRRHSATTTDQTQPKSKSPSKSVSSVNKQKAQPSTVRKKGVSNSNYKKELIKRQESENFGLERFSKKYGQIRFQFDDQGIIEQDSVSQLHEEYLSSSDKHVLKSAKPQAVKKTVEQNIKKSEDHVEQTVKNIEKTVKNISKSVAQTIQEAAENIEKTQKNVDNLLEIIQKPEDQNKKNLVENTQNTMKYLEKLVTEKLQYIPKPVTQNIKNPEAKNIESPIPQYIQKPLEKTDSLKSISPTPDRISNKSQSNKDSLLNELKTNFKNLADVMAMDSSETNTSTDNSVKSDTSFTMLGRKQQMTIIMDLIDKLQNLSSFVSQYTSDNLEEPVANEIVDNMLPLTDYTNYFAEQAPLGDEEIQKRQLGDIVEYEEDTIYMEVTENTELPVQNSSSHEIRPCPLKFNEELMKKIINSNSLHSLREIINEIKFEDSEGEKSNKQKTPAEEELVVENMYENDRTDSLQQTSEEEELPTTSTNCISLPSDEEDCNLDENDKMYIASLLRQNEDKKDAEESCAEEQKKNTEEKKPVELSTYFFEQFLQQKSSSVIEDISLREELEYLESEDETHSTNLSIDLGIEVEERNDSQEELTLLEKAEKFLLTIKKKSQIKNIQKEDNRSEISDETHKNVYCTLEDKNDSQEHLSPLEKAEKLLAAYKKIEIKEEDDHIEQYGSLEEQKIKTLQLKKQGSKQNLNLPLEEQENPTPTPEISREEQKLAIEKDIRKGLEAIIINMKTYVQNSSNDTIKQDKLTSALEKMQNQISETGSEKKENEKQHKCSNEVKKEENTKLESEKDEENTKLESEQDEEKDSVEKEKNCEAKKEENEKDIETKSIENKEQKYSNDSKKEENVKVESEQDEKKHSVEKEEICEAYLEENIKLKPEKNNEENSIENKEQQNSNDSKKEPVQNQEKCSIESKEQKKYSKEAKNDNTLKAEKDPEESFLGHGELHLNLSKTKEDLNLKSEKYQLCYIVAAAELEQRNSCGDVKPQKTPKTQEEMSLEETNEHKETSLEATSASKEMMKQCEHLETKKEEKQEIVTEIINKKDLLEQKDSDEAKKERISTIENEEDKKDAIINNEQSKELNIEKKTSIVELKKITKKCPEKLIAKVNSTAEQNKSSVETIEEHNSVIKCEEDKEKSTEVVNAKINNIENQQKNSKNLILEKNKESSEPVSGEKNNKEKNESSNKINKQENFPIKVEKKGKKKTSKIVIKTNEEQHVSHKTNKVENITQVKQADKKKSSDFLSVQNNEASKEKNSEESNSETTSEYEADFSRSNESIASVIEFQQVFRKEFLNPVSSVTPVGSSDSKEDDNDEWTNAASMKCNENQCKFLDKIKFEDTLTSQLEDKESLLQKTAVEIREANLNPVEANKYEKVASIGIYAKKNTRFMPSIEFNQKENIVVFEEQEIKTSSESFDNEVNEKQLRDNELKKEKTTTDEEDSLELTGSSENSNLTESYSNSYISSVTGLQNDVSFNSSTFSGDTQTNFNISASDEDVDNLEKDLSQKDTSLQNIYNEVEKWEQNLLLQEEYKQRNSIIKCNRNLTLPAIVEENSEMHIENQTSNKLKYILEPKTKKPESSVDNTKMSKQNSKKLKQRHKFLVSLLDEDIRKMNKLSLEAKKSKKHNCSESESDQELDKSESEQSITRKDLHNLLIKIKERADTKEKELKRILQFDDEACKVEDKKKRMKNKKADFHKSETISERERISEITGCTSFTADECKSNIFEDSEIKNEDEIDNTKQEQNIVTKKSEDNIIDVEKHITELQDLLQVMQDKKQHYLACQIQDILKKLHSLVENSRTQLCNSEHPEASIIAIKNIEESRDVLFKMEESLTENFKNIKELLKEKTESEEKSEPKEKPQVIENFKYCPMRFRNYSRSDTSTSASDCEDLFAEKQQASSGCVSESTNTDSRKQINPLESVVMEDALFKETINKMEEKLENLCSMCSSESTGTDTDSQPKIELDIECNGENIAMDETEENVTELTIQEGIQEDTNDKTQHNIEENEPFISNVEANKPAEVNVEANKPPEVNVEAIEPPEEKGSPEENVEQSSFHSEEEIKETNVNCNEIISDVKEEFKYVDQDCINIKTRIEDSLNTLDNMLYFIYNHQRNSVPTIGNDSNASKNNKSHSSSLERNAENKEQEDMKTEILDKLKDFSGILDEIKEEKNKKPIGMALEQNVTTLCIIPEEKTVEPLNYAEPFVTQQERVNILKQINRTIHRVTNKLTKSSEVIEKVSHLKKNLMKVIAESEDKESRWKASEKKFAECRVKIPVSNTLRLSKCEVRRNLNNSLMLIRDLNDVVTNAKTNPTEAMTKLEAIEVALKKQKDVLKHFTDDATIGPKKRIKNYVKENKTKWSSDNSYNNNKNQVQKNPFAPSSKSPTYSYNKTLLQKYHYDTPTKLNIEGAQKKEKMHVQIKSLYPTKFNEKPKFAKSTKSASNIAKSVENKHNKNVLKKFAHSKVKNAVNRTKSAEKLKKSPILPKIVTVNELSFSTKHLETKLCSEYKNIFLDNKSSDHSTTNSCQNYWPSSTSISCIKEVGSTLKDPRMANFNIHNIKPFQSEYPRKDNLKQIDVENTYLFKLVNNLFSESYIKPLVHCSAAALKKKHSTTKRKSSIKEVHSRKCHHDAIKKSNTPSFTSWESWKNIINGNNPMTNLAQNHPQMVKKTVYSNNGVKFCPSNDQKSHWRDMGPTLNDYVAATSKQNIATKKSDLMNIVPEEMDQSKRPISLHYVISRSSHVRNMKKVKNNLPGNNIQEKYEAWKRLCATSLLNSSNDAKETRSKLSIMHGSNVSCLLKPAKRCKARPKKVMPTSNDNFEYGILETKKTIPENLQQKRTKMRKSQKPVSKKKGKNKTTKKKQI